MTLTICENHHNINVAMPHIYVNHCDLGMAFGKFWFHHQVIIAMPLHLFSDLAMAWR